LWGKLTAQIAVNTSVAMVSAGSVEYPLTLKIGSKRANVRILSTSFCTVNVETALNAILPLKLQVLGRRAEQAAFATLRLDFEAARWFDS
jgi:hypothetical protein